jgi:hypothetical protein
MTRTQARTRIKKTMTTTITQIRAKTRTKEKIRTVMGVAGNRQSFLSTVRRSH